MSIQLVSIEQTTGLLPGPRPRTPGVIWLVNLLVDGAEVGLKLRQPTQPTDDQILTALALPVDNSRPLRPSDPVARIERLIEMCEAWHYLDWAATTAAADATFTAPERSRIVAARDAVKARVKGYV